MDNWQICGHDVAAGTKIQTMIEPNVPGYEIPVTLINGKEPGPTLVITAGIHSGEYPGTPALIRTAQELDPERVKGRLLLFHCVNVSGFKAKSPGLIPEDGFNLNGHYPGRPDGTVGERIADFFVTEIFPQTDFILDLHSGGQMEPLTPCLFFPNAAGERVREISLAAARATEIPYLIASTASTGEYSYAASMGVPGLLLERGSCGFCAREWVEAYRRDLRLVLNHFAVYPMDGSTEVCAKKVYGKTIYLTADCSGLWYPAISENARVKKGDLLGSLEDFFGQSLKSYFAEADGTVFYYTSGLAVNSGNPLVAYGLEESVIP